MRPIVAFQGLGQRDWVSLYEDPIIQEAIQWGQEILSRHDVYLEGRPLDLTKACREGGLSLKDHTQTVWQQPAIFAVSIVYWEQWRKLHPDLSPVLLGFSFGEWPAACAAGCYSKETGFLIAVKRGILTSRAGGSSLLITGRQTSLPVKRMRLRCKWIGDIWLANINSPLQGLISGEHSKLLEMELYLKEQYPWMSVTPFEVGGAFHTDRMKGAQKALGEYLEDEHVEWQEPQFPMLLNATRQLTRDPQHIKAMLLRQISARLNFKKLAEELPSDVEIYELCLGRPIIAPLVKQTHSFLWGKQGVRLVAIPFPA